MKSFHLTPAKGTFIALLCSIIPFAPANPQDQPSGAAVPKKLTPTVPVDARWIVHYEDSLKKATEEHKDLLLLFTAPDWIPLCQAFDDKILNQSAFLDPIVANFIPVRLEFPRFRIQSDQEKKQNEILMRVYRVSGFPALILSDEKGRPYAVTGFQPMSPKSYVEGIVQFRTTRARRDTAFAEAGALTGIERAKKLASGIPDLPGNLAARFYRKEMEEVIRLDDTDATGKRASFQTLIADVDYATKMSELGNLQNWDAMIALTDAHIARQKLTGGSLQNALLNKAGLLDKKGDVAGQRRTLEEILAAGESTTTAQKAKLLLKRLDAATKP